MHETAGALEAMGATHKQTGHGEVVVDRRYKLVTSPCYMLDATILDIAEGADAAVKALLELM
jgi:enhancing lycopene biosynthesis protein 2